MKLHFLVLFYLLEHELIEWIRFGYFECLKTMVFERSEHQVRISRHGRDIFLVQDVVKHVILLSENLDFLAFCPFDYFGVPLSSVWSVVIIKGNG